MRLLRWHRPVSVLVVSVAAFTAAMLMQKALPSDDDRDIMLGTWTDEAGEPGNSIHFYLEEEKLGEEVPLVKAYMGRIELVHFLGEEKRDAIWNYGGWDPLILNVTIGKRMLFAVIRKIDNDHILIRFSKDAEEMYRPDAIDHSTTMRLKRIARNPGL